MSTRSTSEGQAMAGAISDDTVRAVQTAIGKVRQGLETPEALALIGLTGRELLDELLWRRRAMEVADMRDIAFVVPPVANATSLPRRDRPTIE